jgi:hypothetical protein
MSTTLYDVPKDEEFGDEAWLPAIDLEKIADRLIEKRPELAHLYDFQTKFFWRRKGGESGGHLTLGKCAKVGGLAKAFAPRRDLRRLAGGGSLPRAQGDLLSGRGVRLPRTAAHRDGREGQAGDRRP